MKKSTLFSTLLVSLVVAAPVAPAIAAPDFNSHKEVRKKQCDDPQGKVVINVNQKIVNDADSGFNGYWAFDAYDRHIQVWLQADGNYCALVSYHGKFDAIAGQTSPGTTAGVLTGKEDGPFDGGYRALVSGTLKLSPTWDTRGNVGTFDYGCNLSGICPGYVSWTDQYFESAGFNFNYEWWGWEYGCSAEFVGGWCV